MQRTRRSPVAGVTPLTPRRKWRAILIATLLFVPAYWSLLAGIVAASSDEADAPNAGALFALGFALLPFVFIVLAFLSEHPRAPGAAARAMGLAILVGIPVSALAADAVTGLIAGVGAGGIAALRSDAVGAWKPRALGVLAASAYVFLMLRMTGALVLVVAPALPFTAIGVADHLAERRRERPDATG